MKAKKIIFLCFLLLVIANDARTIFALHYLGKSVPVRCKIITNNNIINNIHTSVRYKTVNHKNIIDTKQFLLKLYRIAMYTYRIYLLKIATKFC
jgi:hypothetical protein